MPNLKHEVQELVPYYRTGAGSQQLPYRIIGTGVPYRVFVAAPAHAQWMGAVMQLLTSSIDIDLQW